MVSFIFVLRNVERKFSAPQKLLLPRGMNLCNDEVCKVFKLFKVTPLPNSISDVGRQVETDFWTSTNNYDSHLWLNVH